MSIRDKADPPRPFGPALSDQPENLTLRKFALSPKRDKASTAFSSKHKARGIFCSQYPKDQRNLFRDSGQHSNGCPPIGVHLVFVPSRTLAYFNARWSRSPSRRSERQRSSPVTPACFSSQHARSTRSLPCQIRHSRPADVSVWPIITGSHRPWELKRPQNKNY